MSTTLSSEVPSRTLEYSWSEAIYNRERVGGRDRESEGVVVLGQLRVRSHEELRKANCKMFQKKELLPRKKKWPLTMKWVGQKRNFHPEKKILFFAQLRSSVRSTGPTGPTRDRTEDRILENSGPKTGPMRTGPV